MYMVHLLINFKAFVSVLKWKTIVGLLIFLWHETGAYINPYTENQHIILTSPAKCFNEHENHVRT